VGNALTQVCGNESSQRLDVFRRFELH